MIIVNHRFSSRLIQSSDFNFIKTIIVGTFNPGPPDISLLDKKELAVYENFKNKDFNLVKNFYDRPQNRFWGVMDRIKNKKYYEINGITSINLQNGLKYYKGMDRSLTFVRQNEFCINNGIFITDVVSQVIPRNFEEIYVNFQDVVIDKIASKWNTNQIIDIINKFNPKFILLNFKKSSIINNISAQISLIENECKTPIIEMKSTSGAAGYFYSELLNEWEKFI